MNEKEQSASEQWLEARAPGFLDLPDPDRRAIFDFAFLWSLFEAQIMANFARADRIRGRIQPVDATIWLNISAGVWKPRVFLGLSFNCLANALSLACE